MFEPDDYLEWHDATGDAVVDQLHAVETGANAHDIARMRAYVECERRRIYRRDDCLDAAQWLSLEVGISPWKARRWLRAGYALEELRHRVAALRAAGQTCQTQKQRAARHPAAKHHDTVRLNPPSRWSCSFG